MNTGDIVKFGISSKTGRYKGFLYRTALVYNPFLLEIVQEGIKKKPMGNIFSSVFCFVSPGGIPCILHVPKLFAPE